MAQYVALLRGIAPSNHLRLRRGCRPNMRNDRLRGVFEELGFGDVRTVISSGNVIFRSDSTDVPAMEGTLEAAWPELLGFKSTTIIRRISELEELVDVNPFAGFDHGPETYLLVTFCKDAPVLDLELPYGPPDRPYELVGRTERELFTVTDTTGGPAGADVMAWLERTVGKEVSSRTWLTVHRILKRANS